jgi:ABC-type nitrate/sulfonate/bicarbonate transport system ATPase subunit/SAM-dependent methyltransferase
VTRDKARDEYWHSKHLKADWPDDIHFAILSPLEAGGDDFNRGVRLNTTMTAKDIIDRASLYRLANGPEILDYACGKGDLLIELANGLKTCHGVGMDISGPGIDVCRERARGHAELTWKVGGIDALEELDGPWDIIICRDAYYLLDDVEQERFLEYCCRTLRPGGLLYIADLTVAGNIGAEVQECLVDRQHGGQPITWDRREGVRRYSIEDVVRTRHADALEEVDIPVVHERAVELSYRLASTIAQPAVRPAYEKLAQLASAGSGASPGQGNSIPYVRFFFRRIARSTCDAAIGFEVGADLCFKKLIFRKGRWGLPVGKWSLLVGRSGAGKTTFLRCVAGLQSGVAPIIEARPGKLLFLLAQHPVVIEELDVLTNICLFARSRNDVTLALEAVGLSGETVGRKTDSSLSGGERQRVALAQAIAAQPDILLLDEPCTGVDRIRKRIFFLTLKSYLTGKPKALARPTVVCIDHEFSDIEEVFDHVFELIDGRVVQMR